MAMGFEPSTLHYSTDIYKPQRILLIEEHMFLLFCAETPPHDVQAPPPLKALLFTSHTGIVLWSLSLSASCLFFSNTVFPHIQSTSGYLQCVGVCERER